MNSLFGNTYAQLFTDGGYIYILPMKINKESGDVLQNFTDYVGNPALIMKDNSGEQTGHNTEFVKLINNYCIGDITYEPYFT